MEGGYFSSALAGLLSKLGSQAEEISLLIQKQSSARAAIRLELFLPPQLKPTKIPDPLDRQEVGGSLRRTPVQCCTGLGLVEMQVMLERTLPVIVV